jgi:hypothetical protein
MKNSLVWMPFQLGSLFGAILLGLSLIALVRSNSRWDDHLINAVGVFAAGLFVSFTAWLVVTAVRPQPGVSRQTRILSISA